MRIEAITSFFFKLKFEIASVDLVKIDLNQLIDLK